MWTPRLPWAFASREAEAAFQQERHACASRLDLPTGMAWLVLWVSILWRHRGALTAAAVLKSGVHFIVIVAPAYLPLLVGRRAYLRRRSAVVALALLAYVLHPGGGLYRDALMAQRQDGLAAAGLFARLLVGSRTLFWLVLSCGYRLPPEIMAPLHGVLLALKAALKPSAPFCGVLQTPATRPLFHAIAAHLPLVSLIPLDRPAIRPGADICNPLHTWIEVGLGWALPVAAALALDFDARQRFAARRPNALAGAERECWDSKAHGPFASAAVAALAGVHFMTALWYALMWRDLELPSGGEAAARYAARLAASAASAR